LVFSFGLLFNALMHSGVSLPFQESGLSHFGLGLQGEPLSSDWIRDPHNRVTASSKRRARLAVSKQTVIPASCALAVL